MAVPAPPSIPNPSHHIHQYVRNLGGVVEVLYAPSTRTEDPPPSLGRYIDHYLISHGYQSAAIWIISQIALTLPECNQFVGALCDRGMARLEATWVWDMLHDPELN